MRTTLAMLMLFPAIASAAITELAIKSTKPYGDFATGRYVHIEAEARGVVSPTEGIPGLDKATRNAAGMVEYRTPVTLIIPESPKTGNGSLIIDVPNRGRPVSLGLYNSPRTRSIAVGSLDQGTGFLQNRGFSVAAVHWEMGEGPVFPSFDEGGRKLYVEGMGFVMIRDVAIFLRNAPAPGNPLAGAIERVHALGYSQTARVLKSFLANGFNEADGKTAFDGLHIVSAAGGVMPLMVTGPGPGSKAASDTPGHANPEFRGVHEEPFVYSNVIQFARKKNRGKLPVIVVNQTYNDYMGGRASLTRTGTTSLVDAPLPENVRIYDIAGAPHSTGRNKNPDCAEAPSQLDWSTALRAQLVALDEWTRGKAPPASRLFVLEAQPANKEIFQAPAYLPGATIGVPKLDRDGNPATGVMLPDVAVPVASYGAMNAPLTTAACRQGGTTRPFTKEVIEARYPGGINEYVGKVRATARALVADRLLLEEDAVVIVNAAADNPALTPTRPRARGATTAGAAQ